MGCFNHIPSNLLESFWRQSLRTAALARHWSAHSAVDGELAYVLGLLRCIGQLLMRQGWAERMLAMDGEVDPAAPTRMVSERAALGFSYAEVGAELARRWLLPSLFSEVISATDALPVDSNAATLAALIQIAAWQAWVSEQQLGDEQVDAMWPSELAQRAGVPSQQGGSHFDDWDDLCDNLQDLLTQ
jgi:HD-like signal output (HDOD) protein